jgi:hypothetical protein
MYAFLAFFQAIPEDPKALLDLAISLVQGGNFRALAAVIIFIVVKFGGPFLAAKAPFWGTSKGKAVMVILIAVVTGLFQAFLPGQVPGLSILYNALLNALVAAGGFSLLKPFMPESKPSIEVVK